MIDRQYLNSQILSFNSQIKLWQLCFEHFKKCQVMCEVHESFHYDIQSDIYWIYCTCRLRP